MEADKRGLVTEAELGSIKDKFVAHIVDYYHLPKMFTRRGEETQIMLVGRRRFCELQEEFFGEFVNPLVKKGTLQENEGEESKEAARKDINNLASIAPAVFFIRSNGQRVVLFNCDYSGGQITVAETVGHEMLHSLSTQGPNRQIGLGIAPSDFGRFPPDYVSAMNDFNEASTEIIRISAQTFLQSPQDVLAEITIKGIFAIHRSLTVFLLDQMARTLDTNRPVTIQYLAQAYFYNRDREKIVGRLARANKSSP